jgi:hypothetical protein
MSTSNFDSWKVHSMKVALISPVPEHRARNTQYHLLLPHLLERGAYTTFYKDRKGFKILDNGEAEGYKTTHEDLIRLAQEHKVDEIVCPDVMGNAEETMTAVESFLSDPVAWSWSKNFAAVVHGQNPKEVDECMEYYANEDLIHTIMLPRILGRTMGRNARLQAAKALRSNGCEKPIHCLGAFDWVEEVCSLGWQGIVRGIDTSLPYCLAMKGIRIWDETDYQNEYVSRSDCEPYFGADLTPSQRIRVSYNVDQYLRMAGAL